MAGAAVGGTGRVKPRVAARALKAAPQSRMSDGDRRVLIVAGLFLVVHAVLAWQSRPAGLEISQDGATYYVLGKSLLEGSYRELFRVDGPVHALYPPVYPAQLAVLQVVFGEGMVPPMAWGVFCSVASLAIVYLVLRQLFSSRLALAVLALLAVNPILIELAPQLRSETPFMMMSLASVGCFARPAPTRGWMIMGCAAAILATLTRSAGVVLLPAIALHLLLLRRRKALAGFVVACALTVGSWLVWTALSPEQYIGRSYVADALSVMGLADSTGIGNGGSPMMSVARIGRRVPYYAGLGVPWSMQMPTIDGTPVDNVVGAAVLSLLALAGALVLARKWRVAVFYMLAYAALLIGWTWQAHRFLVPVIPLLASFIVVGGGWVLSRYAKRWIVPLSAVLLIPFVLTGATRAAAAIAVRPDCDRHGIPPEPACMSGDQASFLEAAAYARTALSPGTVVLSLKPAPFYVYTGLKSVGQGPVLAQSDATFGSYLDEQGVKYVLLGHLHTHEPRRLLSRLETMCRRLEVERYFAPRTYLLRLDPANAAPDTEGACPALARYRELASED